MKIVAGVWNCGIRKIVKSQMMRKIQAPISEEITGISEWPIQFLFLPKYLLTLSALLFSFLKYLLLIGYQTVQRIDVCYSCPPPQGHGLPRRKICRQRMPHHKLSYSVYIRWSPFWILSRLGLFSYNYHNRRLSFFIPHLPKYSHQR